MVYNVRNNLKFLNYMQNYVDIGSLLVIFIVNLLENPY
jgi:hypothetical protein